MFLFWHQFDTFDAFSSSLFKFGAFFTLSWSTVTWYWCPMTHTSRIWRATQISNHAKCIDDVLNMPIDVVTIQCAYCPDGRNYSSSLPKLTNTDRYQNDHKNMKKSIYEIFSRCFFLSRYDLCFRLIQTIRGLSRSPLKKKSNFSLLVACVCVFSFCGFLRGLFSNYVTNHEIQITTKILRCFNLCLFHEFFWSLQVCAKSFGRLPVVKMFLHFSYYVCATSWITHTYICDEMSNTPQPLNHHYCYYHWRDNSEKHSCLFLALFVVLYDEIYNKILIRLLLNNFVEDLVS